MPERTTVLLLDHCSQYKPASLRVRRHQRQRSCRTRSAQLCWSSPRRYSRSRRWGTAHLPWHLCKLRQKNKSVWSFKSPRARPQGCVTNTSRENGIITRHNYCLRAGAHKNRQLKACNTTKRLRKMTPCIVIMGFTDKKKLAKQNEQHLVTRRLKVSSR